MKIYSIAFLLFFTSSLLAQNKMDSLLGSKGIFSKLVPSKIAPNATLSFNLKLTVLSTAKGGSKKQNTVILYLNTKDGYTGIDKSLPANTALSPNNAGLDLLVETLTKQSCSYTNSKAAGKLVEILRTNLVNTYNNLPIKKTDTAVATEKKYLNNSLTAFPYFVDVAGLQKKYVRHLYGINYPAAGLFKSYLGSFGVGFYNISNDTFLCLSTENSNMKIEIIKVEKVNIIFDAAGFKAKNQ
jgi:hypothetical protein